MTDSEQHPRKPTTRQLDLLPRLAEERETSFAYPQSFDEARTEIKRLLRMPKARSGERRRETAAVRRAMAERRGDSSSVRLDELSGYGSSAGWKGRGRRSRS